MSTNTFLNLQQKITPKNKLTTKDRFSVADSTLIPEFEEDKIKETVTRKTFSLPKYEVDIFKKVKDRALDYRIVLSDSEIIRLGLIMLDQLSDSLFQEKILTLDKIQTGRPRTSK